MCYIGPQNPLPYIPCRFPTRTERETGYFRYHRRDRILAKNILDLPDIRCAPDIAGIEMLAHILAKLNQILMPRGEIVAYNNALTLAASISALFSKNASKFSVSHKAGSRGITCLSK